jgi:hypothetical protein
VTLNKVTYKTKGCGDYADPDHGRAFLILDMTYVQTAGVGSYNEFDWSAANPSTGDTYEDPGFSNCGPELSSSNGLRGKHHGLVTLDVPAGFKHGQILYSAGLLDDNPSSWKF